MSDHREALERIMRICAESRTYNRRTQHINNVAMYALGMTAAQRHAKHIEIMERVGEQPILAAYLARYEKRKAQLEAKFGPDAAPHNQQQGE